MVSFFPTLFSPQPSSLRAYLLANIDLVSESCELWLHGQCINITERTLPSVYICRFCANTPNMRGGRIRDNGHMAGGVMAPPGNATSPLAHKSFRSFR